MRRLVWWWISGLAFLLALVAVLAFFHTGPAPIRGEADELSSIGSLLIGVAGLLVSIMSLRAARRSDGSDTTHAPALTDVADQLAIAVGRQWDAEAKLRRLNDPDPLPVSWEAADPELVEDWSFLAKTASDWPGDQPPDPRGWAAQPSGLAGSNRELSDVLSHRVPTGRLVVLGELGAGKTILLVRLVLDLLDRRRPGGPVPVLVSLPPGTLTSRICTHGW